MVAGGDKLKSRTLALILILVGVVVLFATSSVLYSSHNIGITIKTNGTDITSISTPPLSFVPPAMVSEIKQKATDDLIDDTSTVDTFKSDIESIAQKYNYTVNVTIVSQFGTDQLPMPATVNGTSMVPTLKDGQQIIVLKTSDLQVGDIVVARHPQYGLIVKRLAAINGDQVYLRSDNRQVEILGTQTIIENGQSEVVTMEKKPLDTWLPRENVIGVVKVY